MDIIFAVYKPISVEEIIANIDIASRTALSEGITSITEPGIGTIHDIGNSPLDLHAYLTARERAPLGCAPRSCLTSPQSPKYSPVMRITAIPCRSEPGPGSVTNGSG